MKLAKALTLLASANVILAENEYAKDNEQSNSNTADDFQTSILYLINRNMPILGIGFGYRYLDYDHPAKNFYFDPQQYFEKKNLI